MVRKFNPPIFSGLFQKAGSAKILVQLRFRFSLSILKLEKFGRNVSFSELLIK